MGAEAAAYQLGHSKIAMTLERYIEEYKEALDTRAVLDGFGTLLDGAVEMTPTPDESESSVGEGDT